MRCCVLRIASLHGVDGTPSMTFRHVDRTTDIRSTAADRKHHNSPTNFSKRTHCGYRRRFARWSIQRRRSIDGDVIFHGQEPCNDPRTNRHTDYQGHLRYRQTGHLFAALTERFTVHFTTIARAQDQLASWMPDEVKFTSSEKSQDLTVIL